MKKNGFTFIELLVVITIFGIIGVMLSDFLIQTLRGENKINITSKVKQTGQLVLDKMVNDIRTAEKVLCVGDYGSNTGNTLIVFKQGNYYRYRVIPEPNDGSTNGYIASDTFTGDDYPNINSSLCSVDLTNSSFFLSDNDPITGVSVRSDGNNPVFKINAAGGIDSIEIKFRAFTGVRSGQTYDFTVSDTGVPFVTSVQVRGAR